MGDANVTGENRTQLQDQLSNLFSGLFNRGAFDPKGTGPNAGGPKSLQDILTNLSLPSYTGQLSAGQNPQQQQAMNIVGQVLQKFGGGQAGTQTSPGNFYRPPGGPGGQQQYFPPSGGGGVGGGQPFGPGNPQDPFGFLTALTGGGPSGVAPYGGGAGGGNPTPPPPMQPGQQPPPMPGQPPIAQALGGAPNADSILQLLMGTAQGGQGYAPQNVIQMLSSPQGAQMLQQLAQGQGPGAGLLGQSAGQNPFEQQLQQLSAQGVDTNMLRSLIPVNATDQAGRAIQAILGTRTPSALDQLAGQAPGITGQASSALMNLANGGSPDFSSAFQAIQNAGQQGIARNTRDLREQFSANGNRYSTDLAGAIGQAQNEGQNNLTSQMAQLALQIGGQQGQTRLGAGQALANLGLGAAQGAADTGIQARGQDVNAASNLGNLQLGQYQAQGGLAQALAQLGLAQRGQTGDILNQAGGLAGQDLTRLGSLGQFIQQNSADTSGNLANLSLQGGAQLGNLFQGAQGQSLQAMLGLPGAYGDLSKLPLNLAQQGYSIGQQGQISDQAALDKQMQEYMRTFGGLFNMVGNYAAGAPVISQPGLGGQLLGAGTTLGAAALGGK